MKPILFAGAALMIGAGIYGFVDYKKTNATEFERMYREKEASPTDVIPEKQVEPVKEFTATTATINPANNGNAKKEESKKVTANNDPRPGVNKKGSKNRKELHPELFSRAPLKDLPEITSKIKDDN